MDFIEYNYNKIIKIDLINRFNYKTLNNLPELEKIVLDFGCKTVDFEKLSVSLLALQLITEKKGTLTVSKKPNIILKIRNGNPVGCKIILTKKPMYLFYAKLIFEIIPKLKKIIRMNKLFSKNTLTYNFSNIFIFEEIEKNYLLFNNLKLLQVTILTTTRTPKELCFLFNSFKTYITKTYIT